MNQRGGLLPVLLLIVSLAVLLSLGATVYKRTARKNKNITISSVDASSSYSDYGINLSPKNFSADGLTDFFNHAKSLHGKVTWAGDWSELNVAGKGPALLINNAIKYNYQPIVQVTAFKDASQSKVVPIRELTDTQIQAYVESAQEFVSANKPTYFGIGIEVNRIYESSPAEYQKFVGLFNSTSDAIHYASPSTRVFTSFQLERLKGLRGGLYGGVNDSSSDDWSLLQDFGKADLIAFTTYPSIIYKQPGDIPQAYYSDIQNHTDKPVAFSEMGWPSGSVASGWDSTPDNQATFIVRFSDLTSTLKPQFTIWSFLYDPNTAVPFSTMGLLNSDGTEKPAWQQFNEFQ